MYNACGLLFLLFGFTMLKFITCFSRGNALTDECQRMNIDHSRIEPQNSEAPFKIDPEHIDVTDSDLGTSISVTLLADDYCRGFMLDARNCDECKSSGRFTLTDPASHTLICGDSVVAQNNNIKKTRVVVSWTPEKTGEFFFRAAFLKEFNMFWLRKPIFKSTAAPITEATSNSTQTSLPVGPIPPPQCTQYTRCVLALLLFSRLCYLGGSSLLMFFRPVSKMATMAASVIELASKTVAAIIILIRIFKYECDSSQIVFMALTVAATVTSLMHTLTVFLYCGPSHELRKCWLCAIIVVDLMDTTITTTAVFAEIRCFLESWLPLLMGVYVILEFMLYLGSVFFKQMGKYQSRGKLRENPNNILEKRTSQWLLMFVIFSGLNVMFTAALLTGVSLVKMKSC